MFETELSTFYKHAQQLRKENPAGGFAVIKDDTIFPAIWPNYSDAKRNGNRFFGNNNFLIKEINEEESNSHIFEELCNTIETQKAQILSLINGGFTNAVDNSSPANNIKLRKYCLDKAIEIFSWRKDFFISKGNTPIEYAEALYKYITTGEIPEFNLPGTRVPNTPTPKPTKLI